MKKTKKISGKVYKHTSCHKTKALAKSTAKAKRKDSSLSVRVVDKCVFTRKK